MRTGGAATGGKALLSVIGAAVLTASPTLVRAEAGSTDWQERSLPVDGGVIDLDGSIRLIVRLSTAGSGTGASSFSYRAGRPLARRMVHRSFLPVGPSLEVGPGGPLLADVRLGTEVARGDREGQRLVLAVEIRRPHGLGPFDPTAGSEPPRRDGSETAAWVLLSTDRSEDGAVVASRVELVEGQRIQLGWVPERLAPPARGVPVGLGARDVTLCVSPRGGVLELSTGERVVVTPGGRRESVGRRGCEDTLLRRVRRAFTPRLPRSAFRPVGPTLAIEGMALLGLRSEPGRVRLRVPLTGRAPRDRRLVIALERIVNEGECFGGRSAGVCETAWAARGHLLVEAHLDDDGRAHARLPVSAQLGLRAGRLRFGWLRRGVEGIDVLSAPLRRGRRDRASVRR